MVGIIVPIVVLLMAFLTALLAAPLFDKKTRGREVALTRVSPWPRWSLRAHRWSIGS
ncbi:hypothetical protein JOF47_002585 [Paeniglutamicibacter kerguelensis]|uniref:Uncharacterized protein n=1 Tax=Paeniglutamicibacter kerguelensis TaxID=254788 RepID=A0ABS4XF39_9MICC|nr:hypothetical protein [Paeniglutamicibacter kerguelensis]